MSINPNYMASATIEYGSRVLPRVSPKEIELRNAYISDIKERFEKIARELDDEQFKKTLDEMYLVREYVTKLREQLSVLSGEYEEVNETEHFIRHALKNIDADDTMIQLGAIGETTDIGILELEKLISEDSDCQEKSQLPRR